MECMNCSGTNDVIDFFVGDNKLILCLDCRHKLATGKLKKIGRPSKGITKKVSITLQEKEWDWLDKQANGNRSRFLRTLIKERFTENDFKAVAESKVQYDAKTER